MPKMPAVYTAYSEPTMHRILLVFNFDHNTSKNVFFVQLSAENKQLKEELAKVKGKFQKERHK